MQSRFISFVEAMVNISIGFAVAYLSAVLLYPLVGMEASHSQYFEVTVYFTLVSVVRMYAVRRWFNGPFHIWLMRFKDDRNKS